MLLICISIGSLVSRENTGRGGGGYLGKIHRYGQSAIL